MSEHAHIEAVKGSGSSRIEVRTVVRWRFVNAEIDIERAMGYEVTPHYCGELACLGPEPTPRYTA